MNDEHLHLIPITNFWPVCVTSVQVYPRKNPHTMIKDRKIQEFLPTQCPNIALNSVEWEGTMKLESGDFLVQVARVPLSQNSESGYNLEVTINAPKIGFRAFLKFDDDKVDDQFFLMPLTEDRKLYFANKKKFGIQTRGHYEYDGKRFRCDDTKENKCLGLYDNGRAHFPYNTNWYWASFTAYVEALGKTISLNMGDGIGTDFNPYDGKKFYEDFLTVDGRMIKLDQTELSYSEENLMETHIFKTERKNQAFPGRHCDLKFEPVGNAKDGAHAIVFGITQYLVYGLWSGECQVDGKLIKLSNILGTVEHVRARW